MRNTCPQCQSADTAQLFIPHSVVVYRKCGDCGCVFTLDRDRSYAEPFIVSRGDPRHRKGDAGSH